MTNHRDLLNEMEDVIHLAKRNGATDAEIVLKKMSGYGVRTWKGNVERTESEDTETCSVRVFSGDKSFTVSFNGIDITDSAKLGPALADAVLIAGSCSSNPAKALADASLHAQDFPDLDICDNAAPPSMEMLLDIAREGEDAGLSVSGITNSDSADASWGRTDSYIVTSRGFAGHTARTASSLSVSLIAEAPLVAKKDGRRETENEYCAAIYFQDLSPAFEIGRKAAEKTLRKLGASKPDTAELPVVFHPDIAETLIDHFLSAVAGNAVMFDETFLAKKMGSQVFPAGFKITDDPLLPRGRGSRPYDAEGLPSRRIDLVEDGVLKSWLLDLESARRLNLPPQGNAARGEGVIFPAPSNIVVAPGTDSPEKLMKGKGLYVTGVMSQGVSILTGNYSRAVTGFMFENGQLKEPVQGISIAGNLKDMFMRVIAANDIDSMDFRRRRVIVPTLRIDGMKMAGK